MSPTRPIILLVIIGVLFVGLFMFRPGGDAPAPQMTVPGEEGAVTATTLGPLVAHPPPSMPDGLPTRLGYVVSNPGAVIDSLDEDVADGPIAGGVLFPVLETGSNRLRVLTNCNTEAWIGADQVEPGVVPIGGERFGQSVFVIDPGHGLPDYGAIGPAGLSETEVNLDVSARLAALLGQSHDIDWATGAVTEGTAIPPAAAAILTRGPEGPNGGDYELGLTFRATVANSVDATALVSIHHNSGPQIALGHPGSEALVAVDDPASSRLGGLIVGEMRASLAQFDADWMGAPGTGLISRMDEDGSDYYTVLEESESPTAISEGAYISNPSEEALAMTDEFRQVSAEAHYRALVRFVTTRDDPVPAPEPVLWNVEGTVSTRGCDVPRP